MKKENGDLAPKAKSVDKESHQIIIDQSKKIQNTLITGQVLTK